MQRASIRDGSLRGVHQCAIRDLYGLLAGDQPERVCGLRRRRVSPNGGALHRQRHLLRRRRWRGLGVVQHQHGRCLVELWRERRLGRWWQRGLRYWRRNSADRKLRWRWWRRREIPFRRPWLHRPRWRGRSHHRSIHRHRPRRTDRGEWHGGQRICNGELDGSCCKRRLSDHRLSRTGCYECRRFI